MAVNIPMELLRSFVAIVETGSMLQATERVFVTQSALSLQMRRLEDIVRHPIFERKGRSLQLTLAGEHLLTSARQILEMNDQVLASLQGKALSGTARIGLNQDFVESFLPGILRDFVITHPEVQLQVRVAGGQELLELLRASQLDVVLCVRPAGSAKIIRSGPMCWIGHEDLLAQEVLPLALLEEPCLFRGAALRVLEEAGRPFRIVVETASLSGVQAAVRAGLAITCRNPLFIDPELMPLLPTNKLPALPSMGYGLFVADKPSEAAAYLAELVNEAVESIPSPPAAQAAARREGSG